jgi:hypothetical protein
MNDSEGSIRKWTVVVHGKEIDLRHTTLDERWDIMWQLTIEAYAKMGIDVKHQPMRKDITGLINLREK